MAGKVNLQDQFARFDDYWSPKIVASVNDYDVKLVKVRGEFVGTSTTRPMKSSSSPRANCASSCKTAMTSC